MYLRITSKCNMQCPHCLFSCCPGKGKHMPMDVLAKALEWAEAYGDHITIGGGEPCLHPKFLEILIKVIALQGQDAPLFIVTNGSIEKHALLLAKLASSGVIGADLSDPYDGYHDPDMVSQTVVDAFRSLGRSSYDHGYTNIRNAAGRVIAQGRAVEEDCADEDGCACPDLVIEPDGTVKGCACPDAPTFGNVLTGVKIPDDWVWGECSKDQEDD